MFALYATSHDRLTAADLSGLSALPGSAHLERWLEQGGQPCRLINSENLGDLRLLRRELAGYGLHTEIMDPSWVDGRAATVQPREATISSDALPASDSGVRQFRTMMAEIADTRSSGERMRAKALAIPRMQLALYAAIAVVGIALAVAI